MVKAPFAPDGRSARTHPSRLCARYANARRDEELSCAAPDVREVQGVAGTWRDWNRELSCGASPAGGAQGTRRWLRNQLAVTFRLNGAWRGSPRRQPAGCRDLCHVMRLWLLDYERAIVRVFVRWARSASSTCMPCAARHSCEIGDRPRQLDGAHIAFAEVITNPMA